MKTQGNKERPILFSGPMVRAILEKQKNQTRRVIRPQPCWQDGQGMVAAGWSWDISPKCKLEAWGENEIGKQMAKYCPYGALGDRLWVRETIDGTLGCDSYYLADETRVVDAIGWDRSEDLPFRVIPSIHMPRWASRITLEITNVRVERLQEISEDDAKAEGCDGKCPIGYLPAYHAGPMVYHYSQIWESINGNGSWDANPWVWVIKFKRMENQK